jgi:hypothetical protein
MKLEDNAEDRETGCQQDAHADGEPERERVHFVFNLAAKNVEIVPDGLNRSVEIVPDGLYRGVEIAPDDLEVDSGYQLCHDELPCGNDYIGILRAGKGPPNLGEKFRMP